MSTFHGLAHVAVVLVLVLASTAIALRVLVWWFLQERRLPFSAFLNA